MQGNPVHWFEIYVEDMPRAKAFYEAVLDVRLTRLESPTADIEMWAFPMQRGGAGAAGALARMKDGPAGGAGTIVYFSTEDCAVEAGRVVANGGKVMKGKFSIGEYGFIALVVDTEGNVVGFNSMK